MRPLIAIVMLGCGILMVALAGAQPPGSPDGDRRPRGGGNGDASASVARMMKLDTNKDGKLTKDEVTDPRLAALFDRADADHDGVVTKEELTAEFKKESANSGPGGPGGRGPGGPGGSDVGPGGPGGRGGPGMGGPPPIGTVLPSRVQEMLKLTSDQKKKIDELQNHVDNQLAQILTDDQKQQLEEMRRRGPGGPGGRGGPPGEGGRPRRPSDE